MGDFWKKLIDSDDVAVDSIIFNGSVAMLALFLFSAYQLYEIPASFNPVSFGGAVGVILGSIGAGKRLRDGVTNGTP